MYMSDVLVGSISDVELTKMFGFLNVLEDKPGISVMADRGFTIEDVLWELNVQLNVPLFSGQIMVVQNQQLPRFRIGSPSTCMGLTIPGPKQSL